MVVASTVGPEDSLRPIHQPKRGSSSSPGRMVLVLLALSATLGGQPAANLHTIRQAAENGNADAESALGFNQLVSQGG